MKRFGLLLLLCACGRVSPTAPIVTAGAALAEVAVYRATQNGCWGQCGMGSECNHATGLCVHIPCGGECRSGWVCQVSGENEQCIPPTLAIPACMPPLVSCLDGGT